MSAHSPMVEPIVCGVRATDMGVRGLAIFVIPQVLVPTANACKFGIIDDIGLVVFVSSLRLCSSRSKESEPGGLWD